MKKKELCQITGVSTSTLRYYVDQKIILPQKNQENGYYSFSQEDALLLLYTRELRELGFSIEEATHLVQSGQNLEVYNTATTSKYEALLQEKRLLEEQIQALHRRYESMQNLSSDVFLYREPMPTYAAFFRDQKSSDEAVRTLNKLLPASRITLQINPDNPGFQLGLTLTTQNYQYLSKMKHLGLSVEALARDRILMNKFIPDLNHVCAKDFAPVFNYAKRHAFHISSPIFCIVQHVFMKNQQIGCHVCGGVCYTDI